MTKASKYKPTDKGQHEAQGSPKEIKGGSQKGSKPSSAHQGHVGQDHPGNQSNLSNSRQEHENFDHIDDHSRKQTMEQSSAKISELKSNLHNLEQKVMAIRESRNKQKIDILDRQAKMNTQLNSLASKHVPAHEDEEKLAKVVTEEVHHRPNSLTKHNLKLKQENQKLREQLLEKGKETDRLTNEIKALKTVRDDQQERIQELMKIIEGRHRQDEQDIRSKNQKSIEADEAVREQRVGYQVNTRTDCS